MKKIYALIALTCATFVCSSALAQQGNCTLNLVKEDGNFSPADYDANGRATYDVTMPFTDGYYPNPWTSTQPKPRLPFSNCITYFGVPYNAKINSVSYSYTFKEAVLVANYEILLGFFTSQNRFYNESKRGGGFPRGSGIPLNGANVSALVNSMLLRDVELELRSRVVNPEINSDCPSYIPRDECRTKNSRLTHFTVNIAWSN
ncbi:hypothetical protein [Pseudoalteromonas byunsanensis]|uniref:Uncharacterized protein n=1 Tax=Pseudoalteromonas byunsanensis TaxID=327939 RepID=A0A1S1N874_9GAMM|nr:hypothetical protein [Pseudoalteromonas byunsanensis]OHU95698.1 hypothetical protein BIW53_07635 [Pseudoalteromonas byunsanensis]